MWSTGKIKVGSKVVEYSMKRYDNPSNMGIDQGRISKLTLKVDGKIILNYDRGWDVTGRWNRTARTALKYLVANYN